MKHTILRPLASAALLIAGASLFTLPAAAQAPAKPPVEALSNIVPEDAEAALKAKVTNIDMQTRDITLVSPSGTMVHVIAGPNIRLNLLKTGDEVLVHYLRSVAFAITPPSSDPAQPMPSGRAMKELIARPTNAPGGVQLRATEISGQVVGIDLAAKRLDVIGRPGGPVRTIQVTDPERVAVLKKLHIGDTVTAIVSETLAIGIERDGKLLQ